MNGRDEKNLKKLFERFLDSEQAERCVEDVQKAEQILREYPAPEPDDLLIANIKAEIALHLLPGKADASKRMLYKAAIAAAAAVIILAAIGLRLFEKGAESGRVVTASIIPSAIWESDNIASDDVDLAFFTAEIEQIDDEMMTLQLGKNGGNGSKAVSELEMELDEIEGDFWKG